MSATEGKRADSEAKLADSEAKLADAAPAGAGTGVGAGGRTSSTGSMTSRASGFRDMRGLSIGTLSDDDIELHRERHSPRVPIKPMNEYFKAVPVTRFAKPALGHVVSVSSDDSVKLAVDLLGKHKIMSLPVKNADCPADADAWDDKYVGMLTMFDIVHFVLDHDPSPKHLAAHRPGLTRTSGSSLLKAVMAKSAFAMVKVSDVLDRAHRFRVGKLLAIPETGTFLDLLLILGKHGRHRIVVEDEHDITNIITQRAVLGMLHAHLAELTDITHHTVHELGLDKFREVFTVGLDEEARNAFRIILEKHVSAVPVVDAKGTIVGNISNSDIKATVSSEEMSTALHKTVRQFLEMAHTLDTKAPSITVHANETLEKTIRMLHATGIHRVYVVNDEDQVTGVVSLGDILSLFVSEPAGYLK